MEVSITSVVMNSMLCSILSIFMVDLNGAIRLSETSARRHEIWLGKRHVVDGSDGVAGEASSIFQQLFCSVAPLYAIIVLEIVYMGAIYSSNLDYCFGNKPS
jgi:hypothetical protein